MLGQCTIFCGSIGLNWLNMCPLTWMLHLPIPASGWLMEPQSVRWNRPSNRRMFDSYVLMMGVKNCWRAQNCWSQSRRFYFSAFCICGTCVWYFKVYVFLFTQSFLLPLQPGSMVAKGSPENRIRLNLKALHRTAVAVFLSHFLRAWELPGLWICQVPREFPGHQSPVSNVDLFTSKKWIRWFHWDENGFITGKVNPC